jgi:hypothetical protein
MIATVRETINVLNQMYGDRLDETLVVTWWSERDFSDKGEDALEICEDALDICIGHINDTVDEFAEVIEEEDE